MFSISSKARYGLTALVLLAQSHGQGLMQAKQIAAAGDIPLQFLEQIFNHLVKNGIVRSVRGKKGGYHLLSDPEDLSVLNILEVLDGDLELAHADSAAFDAAEELLLTAEHALRKIFSCSLAALAARHTQLRAGLMFHI